MCQGTDGAPQGRLQLYSRFQPIGPPATAASTSTSTLGGRGAGKNRLSRAQLRQDAAASEEVGGLWTTPGGNTLSSSRGWSVGAGDVVTVVAVAPDGGNRCAAIGRSVAGRLGYVQAVRGGISRSAVPRVQTKLYVVGEGEGPGERRGLQTKRRPFTHDSSSNEFNNCREDPGRIRLVCKLN